MKKVKYDELDFTKKINRTYLCGAIVAMKDTLMEATNNSTVTRGSKMYYALISAIITLETAMVLSVDKTSYIDSRFFMNEDKNESIN